jgi:hypothetical protein
MKHNKALHGIYLALIGLALVLDGCAVDGGVGDQPPPLTPRSVGTPAARMGLAPALRPFHDELEQYGDWVLVEPQGWVFRPRVNTVAWRPYQDGHWEPSYAFGWVWESNDSFGWLTDHYGFWFNDKFQGWVWQPYGAWAPSWVAWVQVGDFVGWAPLPPAGLPAYEEVPGGLFTYVPATALAQPNAALHASFVNAVPDNGQDMQPIERVASYRGVHWNAGPDLGDVLGTAAADRLRGQERDGQVAPPAPARNPAGEGAALELNLLEERTRRVWRVARREFTAARAARTGDRSGDTTSSGTRPPRLAPPRFKPDPPAPPVADSSATSVPGDSLRRFFKRGARPGLPRPGAGNH